MIEKFALIGEFGLHQYSKLVDCIRVSVYVCVCMCFCMICFIPKLVGSYPRAFWNFSFFSTRVTTNEFGEGFGVRVFEEFSFFFVFLGRLHVDRKLSAKVIFTFNALFFFKFTQVRAINGFNCAKSLRVWVKINLYRIWRSALYCTEFIGTST